MQYMPIKKPNIPFIIERQLFYVFLICKILTYISKVTKNISFNCINFFIEVLYHLLTLNLFYYNIKLFSFSVTFHVVLL